MFSFPEAARQLHTTIQFPNPSASVKSVSIDTRTLAKGEMFAALRGTNADGHAYLEKAFTKGASGALINQDAFARESGQWQSRPHGIQNLLPVPDPARALQTLARWRRKEFPIPFVAVTGSVGKTSTKDFLTYLLEREYKVLSTSGNFNNHLGLPLTLLRLRAGHERGIAELGASGCGEIRFLADILQPTHGIITNISPCHLDGFGSLEAIYDAKLELFEALPAGGIAVIPDNDHVLNARASRLPLTVIRVGRTPGADCFVDQVAVEGAFIKFRYNRKRKFAFPGMAPFLAYNAGMAVAMALRMGLKLKDIPDVWHDFKLPRGRFEVQSLGDRIRIIFDGYNANPKSFEEAIETFHGMQCRGRRILVMADMLELGGLSEQYHTDLAQQVVESEIDVIISYGRQAKLTSDRVRHLSKGTRSEHFDSASSAAACLHELLQPRDMVLMKASRGMKIENVLNELRQRRSPAGDT